MDKQKHPFIPSIKIGKHRESSEGFDEEYIEARINSLEKYRYKCQKCGFVTSPDREADKSSSAASGYLEVHHIDDNHENNSPDNLLPLCPFCHMIFNVGFAGYQEMFSVIFLPTVTQANLNILSNCLMVAMNRAKKNRERQKIIESNANSLYITLESFQDQAVKIYGESVKSPKLFGAAVFQLSRKDFRLYKERHKAFAGLRLLPDKEKFSDAVDYWSKYCWLNGKRWEDNWEQVYKQFQKMRKVKCK